MKTLLCVALLTLAAWGQSVNVRYDSSAIGPKGPIPNATIAVCTQPASTGTQPCTPLASLCSSLTDSTCTQPNPFFADSLGNFHFYLQTTSTPVTIMIYGPNVAVAEVIPDQLAPNVGNITITTNHVTGYPARAFIPAALCDASGPTPFTGWNLPATNGPTPACKTGTNVNQGSLNFADGNSAQSTLDLPVDWDTGFSIDSTVFFSSSSTSGTVIFNVALSCTPTNGGTADDVVFNTASAYPTITLGATANGLWSSTVTGLNAAGCGVGNLVHVKVTRATDTAADTAVSVRGVELLIRRTF